MSVESISNSNFINPVDRGSQAPEFKEADKEKQRAERVDEEESRKARDREERATERRYEENSSCYYEDEKGRYVDEVA